MSNLIDEKRICEQFESLTGGDYFILAYWDKVNCKRLFEGLFFGGSGYFSGNDAALLHARVNLALSTLGGLQQGGEEGGEQELLENIVRDLAAALAGKEIEFKDEIVTEKSLGRPHPLETLEFVRQKKGLKAQW